MNYPSVTQTDFDTAADAIVTDITEGIEEVEYADRRVKKLDPMKRYNVLRQISADSDADDTGALMKWKHA